MKAKLGIIGGSGFYEFLKGKEVSVETPYGQPSDNILIAEHNGKKLAFLPRHGKKHQYPPHKINYRANLHSFKGLGVERVIAPCAVGSLKPEIKPGDFVICDQFIDRTKNRKDTYFDGPARNASRNDAGGPKACPPKCEAFGRVAHISMAEPYCPELRKLAILACEKLAIPCHKTGTVVVIEGPRFSTKAESNFYSKIGDVINMTQYPEVALARELEMCYLNISLVTDYDAGLKTSREAISTGFKAVTAQEVLKTFKENTEKLKQLILEIIKNIPKTRACPCGQALKDAFL